MTTDIKIGTDDDLFDYLMRVENNKKKSIRYTQTFLMDITLGRQPTPYEITHIINVGWCKCGSDLADCVRFCYQCGEKSWNEDWDFQYSCRGCGEEKDHRLEAKCDYDDYCYECCGGRGCDCPTCENN